MPRYSPQHSAGDWMSRKYADGNGPEVALVGTNDYGMKICWPHLVRANRVNRPLHQFKPLPTLVFGGNRLKFSQS